MKFSNLLPSIITFIFSTFFMTSCIDSNNSLVPRDEYDNFNGYYRQTIGQKYYFEVIEDLMKTKNKYDTAFLGFLFNVPKSQNENVINSKIKDH